MPWWFVIMANWELKKTNMSFGYCWQLIILYLQKVQEIWYSQKKVNIQRNLQIIYYKGFGNKYKEQWKCNCSLKWSRNPYISNTNIGTQSKL